MACISGNTSIIEGCVDGQIGDILELVSFLILMGALVFLLLILVNFKAG